MAYQFKKRIVQQVNDILLLSGKKIIQAKNFISFF